MLSYAASSPAAAIRRAPHERIYCASPLQQAGGRACTHIPPAHGDVSAQLPSRWGRTKERNYRRLSRNTVSRRCQYHLSESQEDDDDGPHAAMTANARH